MNEDTAREYRIDQHFLELKCAQTPIERRNAFNKMAAEIRQRSAEQVAAMEIAKGLR